MPGFPSSIILPIFRAGSHYLEILSGRDFELMFEQISSSTNIQDISSLGIYAIGPDGFGKINFIQRNLHSKFIEIQTSSGRKILLPHDQKIITLNNNSLDESSKSIKGVISSELSIGDIPILFAGSMPQIKQNMEYINLITELLEKSIEESKLMEITVHGVRNYLEAIVEGSTSRKTPNKMTLLDFSTYIAEHGVYEGELELLELSSPLTPYPINPRLAINPELFELLGYFWRFGSFNTSGIPVLDVPNYTIASHFSKLARNVFDAGSTIIPGIKNRRNISLGTEIHGIILRLVFGLSNDKQSIPFHLYNTSTENFQAFLKALIRTDATICSNNSIATQKLILLLNSRNLFPRISTHEEIDSINLTETDLKQLENGNSNSVNRNEDDVPDLEQIISIKQIILEKPEFVYIIGGELTYYAGAGFVLKSSEIN